MGSLCRNLHIPTTPVIPRARVSEFGDSFSPTSAWLALAACLHADSSKPALPRHEHEEITLNSLQQRLMRFYEPRSSSGRILGMEGARGIAVLLVFFVHFNALFANYLDPNSGLRAGLRFLGFVGNAGVDLFFVISGYLIYSMLIRKPVRYGHFLKRRAERIYPVFLSVFSLYLVLSLIFPDQSKIHGTLGHQIVYILENLFLLPGILHIVPMISVAWSLSFEFFFYLLVPILVMLFALRRIPSVLRLLIFVFLFALIIATSESMHISIRFAMFVAGILTCEVQALAKPTNLSSRLANWVAVVAYVCSLWFMFHARMAPVLAGLPLAFGRSSAVFLAFASGAFCLVGFFGKGFLNHILSWRPLRWLGNCSYSYYLIHGLILKGVALIAAEFAPGVKGPFAVAVLLVIGFSATIVGGTFLFAVVEKPFSMKKQYAVAPPAALDANAVQVYVGHDRNTGLERAQAAP